MEFVGPTTRLYEDNPLLEEFTARALRVIARGFFRVAVILDKTAFYPGGKGQSCDHGVIWTPRGRVNINMVYADKGGVIIHEGKLSGRVRSGDEVSCRIDWHRRLAIMKINTAALAVIAALRKLLKRDLVVRDVTVESIGRTKCKGTLHVYGSLKGCRREDVERLVNEILGRNLKLTVSKLTAEEARSRVDVPADVDEYLKRFKGWLKYEAKEVRVVSLDDVLVVPEVGITLPSTEDVGPVKVTYVGRRLLGPEGKVTYVIRLRPY